MMSGFDELARVASDLKRASREVRPRTIAVLQTHGDRLAAVAKSRCPRDTGRLADSIWATVRPIALSAEVGPYAFYGHFVEFGTSKLAPSPYMGPALDDVAPDFEAALAALGGDLL